jgi:hypothetical protein
MKVAASSGTASEGSIGETRAGGLHIHAQTGTASSAENIASNGLGNLLLQTINNPIN